MTFNYIFIKMRGYEYINPLGVDIMSSSGKGKWTKISNNDEIIYARRFPVSRKQN